MPTRIENAIFFCCKKIIENNLEPYKLYYKFLKPTWVIFFGAVIFTVWPSYFTVATVKITHATVKITRATVKITHATVKITHATVKITHS